MRGQIRIESMYAFVMVDPTDNTEGIPAFVSDTGPMPMVGADMARVHSLRPIAKRMAAASGATITLCHFTNREEVEVINGA